MKKLLVSLVAAFLLCSCTTQKTNFSNDVIDLGIVVKDISKSVKFYKEIIGMQEIPGFTGAAKVTGDSGLADYQDVDVRMFVLSDSPKGSKIKIMQFTERPGKLSDQTYLHSTYGLSYITIFVKDMNVAMQSLSTHGVKPDKKSPVLIPGTDLYLAVVRDPDGNFVELVGPRK